MTVTPGRRKPPGLAAERLRAQLLSGPPAGPVTGVAGHLNRGTLHLVRAASPAPGPVQS